jgi:hypothetical protein
MVIIIGLVIAIMVTFVYASLKVASIADDEMERIMAEKSGTAESSEE